MIKFPNGIISLKRRLKKNNLFFTRYLISIINTFRERIEKNTIPTKTILHKVPQNSPAVMNELKNSITNISETYNKLIHLGQIIKI